MINHDSFQSLGCCKLFPKLLDNLLDFPCRLSLLVSHSERNCMYKFYSNSSRCLPGRPEHSAIQTAEPLFWPGPSQRLERCSLEFWSVLHSAGWSEIASECLNQHVLLAVWTVRGHKLPAWLDWFWRSPAHSMNHFISHMWLAYPDPNGWNSRVDHPSVRLRASLFPIQSGPRSLQRANNAKLTCSPIITSTPSRLSYSIVFTRFITYSHTKPSGISWSQMIQMIKVTHWIPMIADHPNLNKTWGRGWSLAFLASSRTWTSCRNLALSAKASVFHPSTQHAWTCQIYTNTYKYAEMIRHAPTVLIWMETLPWDTWT